MKASIISAICLAGLAVAKPLDSKLDKQNATPVLSPACNGSRPSAAEDSPPPSPASDSTLLSPVSDSTLLSPDVQKILDENKDFPMDCKVANVLSPIIGDKSKGDNRVQCKIYKGDQGKALNSTTGLTEACKQLGGCNACAQWGDSQVLDLSYIPPSLDEEDK